MAVLEGTKRPSGTQPDPAVIRTIIRVGRELGATKGEIIGALAGGLVESGLRDLDYGDRDSLGVFQQRESIYGRLSLEEQVRAFFAGARGTGGEWKKGLLQTRGQGPMGQRIQSVQVSAFPDRYRERMDDARALGQQYNAGGKVSPQFITLVQLGRMLERAGYSVGENSAFDGETPTSGHSDNSHHYRDDALDINANGPRERRRLNRLGRALRNAGLDELFFPKHDPVGGHQTHLHAADVDDKIRLTRRLAKLLDLPLSGIGSFPVPGVDGGAGYVPDLQVPEYPTTPLPLGPDDIARMAAERAAATSNLRETRIARNEGAADIKAAFRTFVKNLDREVQRDREEVMEESAARNLAFQPAFVAPRLRDLREDRSAAVAQAASDRTEGLQDLADAVAKARRARDDVIASNRRERARLGSQLDRLIGQ